MKPHSERPSSSAGVPRETPPSAALQLHARLAPLGISLTDAVTQGLIELLDELEQEPQNLTAIRGIDAAIDRHLADSLSALVLPEVHAARRAVDVGSGGGFPGIPLAAALPALEVTLVESEGRKARWLQRCGDRFPNLRVVADRSENLAAECREAWDLATARALAAPAVALELCAPLVSVGGSIVLWRSRNAEPALDRDAQAAAEGLGLERRQPVEVEPFPGAMHLFDRYAKREPTPERYPRRPGMAAKRPLRAGR